VIPAFVLLLALLSAFDVCKQLRANWEKAFQLE